MIRLYGINSCDTCRKARKWLRDRNIDYEYIDVRENLPSKALLTRWQKSVNWEDLLNRRSATWRGIPASERDDLNAARARNLIIDYPTVIKRPLLDLGDRVVLGFSETTYANLDL